MARQDKNIHALVRRILRCMMMFRKRERERKSMGGSGRSCLRKHNAFFRRRRNSRAYYHPRHSEFIILMNLFIYRAECGFRLLLLLLFPKITNKYNTISSDFYRRTSVNVRVLQSRCVAVLEAATLEIRHRDLSRTRSVECNELSEAPSRPEYKAARATPVNGAAAVIATFLLSRRYDLFGYAFLGQKRMKVFQFDRYIMQIILCVRL